MYIPSHQPGYMNLSYLMSSVGVNLFSDQCQFTSSSFSSHFNVSEWNKQLFSLHFILLRRRGTDDDDEDE